MPDSISISDLTVSADDARQLVTALLVNGTPSSLMTAERITTCLETRVRLEPTARERNTILSVLTAPRDGLVELRGRLARADFFSLRGGGEREERAGAADCVSPRLGISASATFVADHSYSGRRSGNRGRPSLGIGSHGAAYAVNARAVGRNP